MRITVHKPDGSRDVYGAPMETSTDPETEWYRIRYTAGDGRMWVKEYRTGEWSRIEVERASADYDHPGEPVPGSERSH